MADESKESKKLGDVFKKVVSTGITAAFQTEENIRAVLQELPLPKDVVNGLLQNARHSKDEFIKSIKSELGSYLNAINLSEEIEKVLDKYDFEVNATIRLQKKADSKSKNAKSK